MIAPAAASEVAPPSRLTRLVDHWFGFAFVEEDRVLDAETSFFRLVCFERGTVAYRIALGAGIVMQSTALICEWKDPQVDPHWLLLGQNHVSLAVLFYLFLCTLNTCLYQGGLSQPVPPVSVKIQWMLHVALLPATSLSAIAYWRLFRGSSHDSGVQASKATALATMIFMGLFGLYEARWNHLLYTLAILLAHIMYVLTLAIAGNFIYSNVLTLNQLDLFIWGIEFAIYNVLIHSGYILVQQWKVYKRQGGTLWKTITKGPGAMASSSSQA